MRNDPMPLAVRLMRVARAASAPEYASRAIGEVLMKEMESNRMALTDAVKGLSWMTMRLLEEAEQDGQNVEQIFADFLGENAEESANA